MEERYFYMCMECGKEWEGLEKNEKICPCCGVGDIHVDDDENLQDDEK